MPAVQEESREQGEVSTPTYCPASYPAVTRIDPPGGQNLRVRPKKFAGAP
jgi:hypothetical protein